MSRTEVTDLDNIILQVGEVQVTPTALTVLDRLKTINTSLIAMGNNNFTTLNSINLDLSKTDLDNILIAENLRNNPFFTISQTITRPNNIIAYAVNQAFGNYTGSVYGTFALGLNNSIVQIDEISILNSNQNTPLITPTIYLSGITTGLSNFTDQTIPVLGTALLQMEIVVGGIMVKVPGNSGNYNVLKNSIVNTNIKLKCDGGGNLYFGIITTSVFTPQAFESMIVTIKGRVL